jgi:hypothetical protein
MKNVAPLMIASCLLAGCLVEKNIGNTGSGSGSGSGSGEPARKVFEAPRWALTLGSTGDDIALSVAVDPSGDVIATGYFDGTVDFGNEAFTSQAWAGSWISKRAGADGHDLWTVPLGIDSSSVVTVSDVAVAGDGSIIVAGTYNGDLHLEQQVLHGPPIDTTWDCFVAKYDTSGHLVWARGMGPETNADDSFARIAVGVDGRIALVTPFAGTVTVPSGTFTASPPVTTGPEDTWDIFLAVFDSDGQLTWGVTTRTTNSLSVAMTAEDDVVLSGALSASATLDGVALQPVSSWGGFAARFNVGGTLLWVQELGAPDILYRAGPVALAADGSVLVTGTNELPVGGVGNGVPAINAYDPNGQHTWSTQAPGGSAETGVATVLSNGTVVTGGPSGFPIDFGGGMLRGSMFLAAHDSAGNTLDAVVYGASDDGDEPFKLASSTSGAFALAGFIQTPIDFGAGPLRFAGRSDALIMMMDTLP